MAEELMGEVFNGTVPEHRGLLILVRWMTEGVLPPLTDDEVVRLVDWALKAMADALERRALEDGL